MNKIHLSLAALLVFASCTRPDDEVTPQPDEVISDSTLVKRIAMVSKSQPGAIDTVAVAEFEYDGLKRPKQELFVQFDRDSFVIVSMLIKYFFKDQATLPYLVTRENKNNQAPESDSYDSLFLQYENGIVSYDSMVTLYAAGDVLKQTQTHKHMFAGASVSSHWHTRLEYLANVTREVDQPSVLDVKWLNGNMLHSSDGNFNYPIYIVQRFNDHPDPVQRFSIPFPYQYYYGPYWLGMTAYKNLMTYRDASQYPITDPNASTGLSISYTYRSDGYPLIRYYEPGRNSYDEYHYFY